MSKKKSIIIIVIAAIVLTVLTGVVASNVFFNPYKTQIKLAYKYLNDGEYNAAILTFDKAIEIDARRPDAYIGKADVYATRGDENTVSDITNVLTTAKEQDENNTEEIVNAVLRLADFLKENGYERFSIDLLEAMYENIQDERIKQKADKMFEQYYKNILANLYNNGEEAIKDFFQSEEIGYLISKMSENDYFWYSETDDISAPGSKAIALYPDELIYIGEWANNVFEGTGKYYNVSTERDVFVSFEGIFSGGMPNGIGTETWEYLEGIYEEDGDYTMKLQQSVGNFENAIRNGEFEQKVITEAGDIFIAEPTVLYENGVPRKYRDYRNHEGYITAEVPGYNLVWWSVGDVEYAPCFPRSEAIAAAME